MTGDDRSSATVDRRLLYGAMVVVFIASFAFRFLDPVLLNDHFEHVSMAMQIVHGETPGVDFFDPGRPLQQYLSAAGLWLFGHQRLAEVLLSVGFLSAGTALVVLLAADVSGSLLLGLCAALLVMTMGTRLYAYPKIAVAALVLLACSRYIDVPSRRRLAALSVVTAIAFFFRYDYGLYAGITVVAAMIVRHWGDSRRTLDRIAAVAVLTAAFCAPYVAFLAMNGAFVSGPGTGRLMRLIGGEDLVTLQWFAPPLNSPQNAAALLYDVFFLVPLVAVATLAYMARTGRVAAGRAAKLLATIVLAVFFNLFLIRGNLDSRLPDVVVPIGILMAWLLSLLAPLPGRRLLPAAIRVTMAALVVSVGLAVHVYAEPLRHLERSRLLAGPRQTHGHLLAVVRELSGRPLDAYAGSDARGLPALTRYLARCTTESDHLLVTGYRPEVFFYAARLFAGGMVAFHANLGASPRDQQLIVDRMQHQRVPIVVVPTEDLPELRGVYPTVSLYLDRRYDVAGESGFGESRPVFRVLVDRESQPSHIDAELGLPCFSSGGVAVRASTR